MRQRVSSMRCSFSPTPNPPTPCPSSGRGRPRPTPYLSYVKDDARAPTLLVARHFEAMVGDRLDLHFQRMTVRVEALAAHARAQRPRLAGVLDARLAARVEHARRLEAEEELLEPGDEEEVEGRGL